jgi:hypothetical protein
MDHLLKMGELFQKHTTHSRGFYRKKDAIKVYNQFKSEGREADLYMVNTKNGKYVKYYVGLK